MANRPLYRCLVESLSGDYQGARRFLAGFDQHLGEACIGSISEIFDADEPYTRADV